LYGFDTGKRTVGTSPLNPLSILHVRETGGAREHGEDEEEDSLENVLVNTQQITFLPISPIVKASPRHPPLRAAERGMGATPPSNSSQGSQSLL